nr:PREDICTED: urea amidolyase-like [Bemisia tabaci]
MFLTVLVANRGEIAVRAIRTLKRLGVRSIAVYSEPDFNAPHVTQADAAVPLGGTKAADTYLNIEKILQAAKQSGAAAIFPGYGFLSESAEFADACEEAGIVFIGPTPEQIRQFGLKHRARELASQLEIPQTPGSGLLSSVEHALTEAKRIGYPVMLKSAAGGGGIGLRRCDSPEDLSAAYESVKRLGDQFFSDSGVFVERFVDRARHIEVQIFGDGNGNVVALGERDCSLQRRNQKVVEETPAPNLPTTTREALLKAATRLGESVAYRSAGTVEFIYDDTERAFFFLEVNTRLQVEHPVTEMVLGVDVIECMLRVAAKEELDLTTLSRAPQGAAIEVRIYAENPIKNFQPSPGVLTEVHFPDNVRIDGWVSTASEVTSHYDPLLAKLVVHGCDREDALGRLQEALGETRLHGIVTNLDYLRQIIRDPGFRSGRAFTRLLDTFAFSPSVVEVLEPGTYSTIQDYPGRLGYWDIGVPPSGPMDDLAFRLANRIVGNHASAAGLEFTLQGPTLKFHCAALISLTGAQCPAELDGQPVSYWRPVDVQAGQVLKLGRATSGCRTYLAVRNGFDVPLYLGSRSTFVLGQFGGHAGRTFCPSDLLPISIPGVKACCTPAPVTLPQAVHQSIIPTYSSDWEIAVLYGPHGAPDFFTTESMEEFLTAWWVVHYNSNRLGVRLTGPKPSWTRADGGEAGLHPSNIHDCEYAIGSINFTGDSPVILSKDGPSLGGFVCPVTIAKAEMWKVGQVKPGDRIRFRLISFQEAQSLEQTQINDIKSLSATMKIDPSIYELPLSDYTTILAELPAEGHRPRAVYRQAGDSYILLEYGENILDLALRLRVYLLMKALQTKPLPGLEELAPGVRSLQIRYDSNVLHQKMLMRHLLELETKLGDVESLRIPSRVVHLPMAFEDSATLAAISRYRETVRNEAPWLPSNVDFVQRINGLEHRNDVRDIIFQASYLVLGLGDVYLGAPCAVPVDPRHRLLSSKYNPARTFTAEGTVGLGGMYMCIYGMDSPGGYQLVGRTLPIWNKFVKSSQFQNDQPWLLRFFDQVRFYPVTESELQVEREAFREGRTQIRIEQTDFDFGAYRKFLADNAESIAVFQKRQKAAFDAEVTLWRDEEQTFQPPDRSVDEPLELSGHLVRADLSGSVWKILVGDGQWVQAGSSLLVVEAMKMELTVSAPVTGHVDKICCKPGELIAPGDPLLVISPAEKP